MYLYIYIFTYIYTHIYIMYTTSCVLGIYIIFNISRPLMCTHVYNCRYNYIYIYTYDTLYAYIYIAVEQNWFRIKSPAGEEPMVNHTHSRLPITRITRCSNGHLSWGSHGKVLNHQRLMVNDADEKWMITIMP